MNFIIHCTKRDWYKETYYKNSIVIDGNLDLMFNIANQVLEGVIMLIKILLEEPNDYNNLNIEDMIKYINLLETQVDKLNNEFLVYNENLSESQKENIKEKFETYRILNEQIINRLEQKINKSKE